MVSHYELYQKGKKTTILLNIPTRDRLRSLLTTTGLIDYDKLVNVLLDEYKKNHSEVKG